MKPVKFQGDMSDFCDFIQAFIFTTNHTLNGFHSLQASTPPLNWVKRGHPVNIAIFGIKLKVLMRT